MTCNHISNRCEIQLFDIKEFKYQSVHKIPLSEIDYMYLKERVSKSSEGRSYTYNLVLKTKTKQIELESTPSNFWISSRREKAQKMNAFLKPNSSKNIEYEY